MREKQGVATPKWPSYPVRTKQCWFEEDNKSTWPVLYTHVSADLDALLAIAAYCYYKGLVIDENCKIRFVEANWSGEMDLARGDRAFDIKAPVHFDGITDRDRDQWPKDESRRYHRGWKGKTEQDGATLSVFSLVMKRCAPREHVNYFKQLMSIVDNHDAYGSAMKGFKERVHPDLLNMLRQIGVVEVYRALQGARKLDMFSKFDLPKCRTKEHRSDYKMVALFVAIFRGMAAQADRATYADYVPLKAALENRFDPEDREYYDVLMKHVDVVLGKEDPHVIDGLFRNPEGKFLSADLRKEIFMTVRQASLPLFVKGAKTAAENGWIDFIPGEDATERCEYLCDMIAQGFVNNLSALREAEQFVREGLDAYHASDGVGYRLTTFHQLQFANDEQNEDPVVAVLNVPKSEDNFKLHEVLWKHGMKVIIRIDRKNVAIIRRPDSRDFWMDDERLTSLIERLDETWDRDGILSKGGKLNWFAHEGGWLLASGTKKAPAKKLTIIRYDRIVEVVCKILRDPKAANQEKRQHHSSSERHS